MKACLLHDVGDIRYEDVSQPEPKEEEILVKIKACGICGSDIPRIFEKGTYHFPTIPGHEFSGEIVKIGKSVDSLQIKDRGSIIPLIPCRDCLFCQVGDYELCDNYNYLGSRCDGGFAEYAVVPYKNFISIPKNITFKEAAMVEPASVALHAVRKMNIDIGGTVAIIGGGTVGLIIAQLVRICSAKDILIIDIDDKKLEIAKKLKFIHTINSSKNNCTEWVGCFTKGKGVDVVIEAAVGGIALSQAIRIAKKNGKIGLVGDTSSDTLLSSEVYHQILNKQLQIYGSWNSKFSELPKNEWKVVIDLISRKLLDLLSLVTHNIDLSETISALHMMKNKEQFYIKVLINN